MASFFHQDQCEESRHLRLQQVQESARHFQQHHSVQIVSTEKGPRRQFSVWDTLFKIPNCLPFSLRIFSSLAHFPGDFLSLCQLYRQGHKARFSPEGHPGAFWLRLGLCCSPDPLFVPAGLRMQAKKALNLFLFPRAPMQKRDKRKEEEKKKKAWIKQERQKTLERLKTFNEVQRQQCSPPICFPW